MKNLRFAVAAIIATASISGSASAAIVASGSVGGAPTGAILDNLDWLALGSGGGVSPQSGITVNFTPNAQAVQGFVDGQYARPFLSGGNGTGFGSPNQPDGADNTVYITSGSTGAQGFGSAAAEILLPGYGSGAGYYYFGLIWGSVDNYNTLSFYDGTTLIGSVTGAHVVASPNGDQGVNGTLYVNMTSSQAFNRVIATSSQYAFEFDNIAFSRTVPTPEPGSLALLGLGLMGLGFARRKTA